LNWIESDRAVLAKDNLVILFKWNFLKRIGGHMDLETIFSMIDRAEKSAFNKISIETQDIKLTLEREPAAAGQPPTEKTIDIAADRHDKDSDDLVFAPISGVFYAAREPGAPPFVKEGSRVKKGDVLCIIEAMKTMNEITAPKSGVIESVLKNDSDEIVAKDALFKYARVK
jgi:acetyl-CoA carboxylase biotin carboxyl carrier protein